MKFKMVSKLPRPRRNPVFKHRGKTKTATRETRDSEAITIRYHNTDIVTVHIDGGVTLRSGGWETVTTKRRMNEVADKFGLPYHVYAKKGEWFVYLRDLDQTLPFTSGMHFYPRKRATHSDPESALTNPKRKKAKRRVTYRAKYPIRMQMLLKDKWVTIQMFEDTRAEIKNAKDRANKMSAMFDHQTRVVRIK